MESVNQNVNVEYKKPGIVNKAIGAAAGCTVAGAARGVAMPAVSKFCVEQMGKINKPLDADTFEPVRKNMEKIIKETGLAEKGVSIVQATAQNESVIKEILDKDLNSGIARFLPKSVKAAQKEGLMEQLKQGINAFYSTASNKVVVPEKGVELAFFHEVGHALNANKTKFVKILQKCRPLTILALPIMAIGLLKTKKAPGEQPKNALDKTTTFIKDHAGALTFATFMPTVIEEGLASIKGNGLAKQYLDSDLAKKVAKTNRYGFLSYLGMASIMALSTTIGVKVKDAITKTKARVVQE